MGKKKSLAASVSKLLPRRKTTKTEKSQEYVSSAPRSRSEPSAELLDVLRPLAEVATNAWRAEQRMLDAPGGAPLPEMQRIYRFIEGIMKGLTAAGIRIVDHAKEPYDPGLALKVLSFEPRPELVRDEVIQTLRPTVFWKEQLLQLSEVVVGVPVQTRPATEAETPPLEP